ncbi:MAG TPA: PEGA domain-containing protein, partial [Kofleriaceae bacterium]|nr:PEGA domain-containing protein [Kofleriaceae bacterium]
EPPQDATRARARRAATDAEPRPGPATAVIPRDGAPRGKRAPRARTETFATHVALDKILERAAPSPAGSAGPGGVPGPDPAAPSEVTRAPSSGSGGDGDAARGDPTPPRPRANGQPESTDTSDASDASEGSSAPAGPPVQLPGRVPPSAALLVLAGIGALALGGAALFVFFQGREAVLRPDASPRHDARIVLPPGPEPAPDAAEPPADAPPPVDAGAPAILPATPDARPSAPRHDAGGRPVRPDVREPGAMTTHADAGVARPTGTATLTIGANPWGNVLLDGKKIGRTPIERLSVPAGHHVVEVIFSGEDPPRSQRFPLDLDDGDARDVLADFTRP